jgi:hypothetical protein
MGANRCSRPSWGKAQFGENQENPDFEPEVFPADVALFFTQKAHRQRNARW